VNYAEIVTSTTFLNKTLAAPLMISCMTGGYRDALRINRRLAEVCEEMGIAMGVGSQRQALEDTQYHRTFSVVREVAPSTPIIGNIGATEVATLSDASSIRRLVDLIRADAFAVHLNPLQELLQPEGNTNFKGVLKGIELLVKYLPVPVIVKEIGAGISADVARRLLDAGVRHIDVAGAGGTSWAGVEILRRKERQVAAQFWDWGIPTADALRAVAALKSPVRPFTLLASGGISSGVDVAKCIALGADLVGAARPMLKALASGGSAGLRALITQWIDELRSVMFLTGSATIAELALAPLVQRRGSVEITV
jgi:isopentenyl-diphosphate delta-isomerase